MSARGKAEGRTLPAGETSRAEALQRIQTAWCTGKKAGALEQSRHKVKGQSLRVGRGQVMEGFTKCGIGVGFYSKCDGEVRSKGVTMKKF